MKKRRRSGIYGTSKTKKFKKGSFYKNNQISNINNSNTSNTGIDSNYKFLSYNNLGRNPKSKISEFTLNLSRNNINLTGLNLNIFKIGYIAELNNFTLNGTITPQLTKLTTSGEEVEEDIEILEAEGDETTKQIKFNMVLVKFPEQFVKQNKNPLDLLLDPRENTTSIQTTLNNTNPADLFDIYENSENLIMYESGIVIQNKNYITTHRLLKNSAKNMKFECGDELRLLIKTNNNNNYINLNTTLSFKLVYCPN
jgi:hypothetical protein